jgi:hypothetical protein
MESLIPEAKITIGKKFVKTCEDFEKIITEQKLNFSNINKINSLSVVKNYLTTNEVSRILIKYNSNLSNLLTLNL